MTLGLPKNDANQYNNREYNLLLTVGSINHVPSVCREYRSQNLMVNKNNSAITIPCLSALEMQTLIRKLLWMHNHEKITGGAKFKSIKQLIYEVQFHVQHRSNKTPTFLHALRAAARLIQVGRWQTPKRMLYMQSIELERSAAQN